MKHLAAIACVLFIGISAGCASRPSDPEPTDNERQAGELLRAGKVNEAREAFLAAARENEESYIAWTGLAKIEAQRQQSVGFENSSMRASALAPRTPLAFERLGALYVTAARAFRGTPRSRHYASIGVEYLRRVFASNPQSPEVLFNLGAALHYAEDDAASVFILDELLRKEPKNRAAMTLILASAERRKQWMTIKKRLDSWGDRALWSPKWAALYERARLEAATEKPG